MWREILTGDVVQVVAVQPVLVWGNPHLQHVLVFGRQKLSQLGVISSLGTRRTQCCESWTTNARCGCTYGVRCGQFCVYLHTSNQNCMKHMCSLLHDPDVCRRGVGTLAVLYGVDEAVPELAQRAQKIPLDEIDHAVVCRSKTRCTSIKGVNLLISQVGVK